MPLKRRPTKAGLYHIAVRSPTPELFFLDSDDRIHFLTILANVTKNTEWTCLAVCLMGTHYHLVVDAAQGVLPDAMQRINWRYAFDFNQCHGHKGHHVGGKYLSIPIKSDAQLLACFRYVVLNPVRAGVVDRAEQWPWSSYAATIGLREPSSFVDPACVLACFDWPNVDPRAALRARVEKS